MSELPKPREIEEILKDDDMAEHRQLLLERQMMMEYDVEEEKESSSEAEAESKEPNDEEE